MTDSSFDAETFLNQESAGANEVNFTPVPEGEYTAFIDDLDADVINGSPVLKLTFALTDDALKESMGLDKPTVRENIFLDMEEDGSMAYGANKNVRLGRLREAVKQNTPDPWNPNMLRGAGPVIVQITHRMGKNGDGPYANINRITAG